MAEQSSFEIDVLNASPLWRGRESKLAEALSAAATAEDVSGSVSLLLGDDAAIAGLNVQFRGKDGPTNVLSFEPGPESEKGFLGDIALAAETVAREAEAQGKSFEAHAAHLVIHGFLHLLGYNHEEERDAEAMEAREREILITLGVADPYL